MRMTRRRCLAFIIGGMLISLLSGCVRNIDVLEKLLAKPNQATQHSRPLGREGGFKHVVIFAIDGLRAEQLEMFILNGSTSERNLRKALGVSRDPSGKAI